MSKSSLLASIGLVVGVLSSQAFAGVNGAAYNHGHKAVVKAPVIVAGVNGAAYNHGHKAVVKAPVIVAGVNGAAYNHHA